jgi:uncharacterized protein (TIGR03435 family)
VKTLSKTRTFGRIIVPVMMWASLPAIQEAVAQGKEGPAFDVASVRLWTPGVLPSQRWTEKRVDLTNQTLRSVILLAFRAKEYQLLGPDWLDQVRVDIQATVPADATSRQVPEMLQRLLAERFKLMPHRETRMLEALQLLVGKNGIRMREADPLDELNKDFEHDQRFSTPAAREVADTVSDTPDGVVRTVLADLGRTTITARTMYRLSYRDTQTQILEASRMTMAELAAVLANVTGQPVIDRTGLKGLYQFRLELPHASWVRRRLDARASTAGGAATAPRHVSEFEAVETLGLKLQQQPSPIDVIVIDKMDRTPSPN